jgi:ribosomal protein S18 acetylase RimI-like enzyme
MQRNEPFDVSAKSSEASKDLKFRLATERDRESVTRLMAERNPDEGVAAIMKKTDREIALNSTDPNYRLFVADLNERVVGLCRYYHSDGLPKEKLIFPAPPGWYCMGILVDKDFRRKGIARFLFERRLLSLRDRGAGLVYSFVAEDNLASVKMHQKFGFEELERAPGFLHIKFDCGSGVLYRLNI